MTAGPSVARFAGRFLKVGGGRKDGPDPAGLRSHSPVSRRAAGSADSNVACAFCLPGRSFRHPTPGLIHLKKKCPVLRRARRFGEHQALLSKRFILVDVFVQDPGPQRLPEAERDWCQFGSEQKESGNLLGRVIL